jgi:hypothetical protein
VGGIAEVERARNDAVEIEVVVVDVGGGGGTTGLGGDGCRWPNEGIGLVLVVKSRGSEVELVETGKIGFFETICREYVG